MKKIAVIVAGGSGQRMGSHIAKQFLLLQEKPILWHTINSFFNTYDDIEIVLVLPKKNLEMGEQLKANFDNKSSQIKLVIGGETRFESVKNGLQFVPNDAIVFVHDGVRCLVSKDLIVRCFEQTITLGSAIPAVSATDSIRIIENHTHKIINRDIVKIVQTPQTFLSNNLKVAFNQAYKNSFTDEATVVENLGQKVFLCEGDYDNIKITRPLDLIVAEGIIGKRSLK